MQQTGFELFLQRIEALGDVRVTGGWHRANCPACGERKRRLSFKEGDRGGIAIKCHANQCEPAAVLAAVGLTWSDVLPQRDEVAFPARPTMSAEIPDLLEPHYRELREGSGLSQDIIRERRYFSALKKAQLRRGEGGLGFADAQCRVPALVLPVWGVDGEIHTYQLKPDVPRVARAKDAGKSRTLKYETPAAGADDQRNLWIDCPPRCQPLLADPHIPLYITEGIKKADAGAQRGLCIVDLLGVSAWRGRNTHGGYTALPDWNEIALKSKRAGRDVYLVFDSDCMSKREVYFELAALKEWLERKGARCWVVYLPPGPHGEKTGLDDWFCRGGRVADLAGLAEEELRQIPMPETPSEDPEHESTPEDYKLTPAGLTWFKRSQDGGRIPIGVTNFWATIEAWIIRDDGVERTALYQVHARRNCHQWRGTLTPAEFARMDWPAEHLMPAASLLPTFEGAGKHASYAIRRLSEPIPEVLMYAHLGWRQFEGEWKYLHAGGALDAGGLDEGILVEGPNAEFSNYKLPAPPDYGTEEGREELQAAIRTSLRFVEAAHPEQSWPLLAAAYTAPLATLLPTDFALWMRGTTGSRKSTAAAALLCHFGQFQRTTLPANFTSTGNALEIVAFAAKDALLVVDDYAPPPDRRTAIQQDQAVHRLVRGVGDQRGRQRATREGRLQADRYPRCLTLCTSELPLPGSQGSEARTLEVLWRKEAVNLDALRRITDEDSRLYAPAMAGYIQWLAERMGDPFIDELRTRMTKLRGQLVADHGRLTETAAKLLIGLWSWMQYAIEIGALTEDEARETFIEARASILACVARTSSRQADRRPTVIFLAAVRSLLDSGAIYLVNNRGGRPEQEELWGWVEVRGEGHATRLGAEKVGWVHAGELWLQPDNTLKAVRRWVEADGMPFPGTKESLSEALNAEGLLRLSKRAGFRLNAWAEGRNNQVWAIPITAVRDLEDREDEDDAGAADEGEEVRGE